MSSWWRLNWKILSLGLLCSHTPSALNSEAKRSGGTCQMANTRCCYLAKGAKRLSLSTKILSISENCRLLNISLEIQFNFGPHLVVLAIA